MIQVNNSVRRPAPAISVPETNGPELWGQYCGRKHYSLEVTQHPMRARMCGFGDKDRRPLAPAAVAKMIVRGDDNSLVDVDDIDCSFFLVTVDLWSADGKSEMNLVLHPSSADRYVPPHINKPRRRGASISAPQQRSGYQTPASRSTPTPSHYRSADNPNNITTPMLPSQSPGFSSSQGYFGPQSASSDTLSYGPPTPFSAVPSDSGHPTWGYPPQTADRNTSFPPPALPSIHSFGRNSATTGFLSRRGPRAPDEPDVASDRIFAKYPYLAQNEFELRATIKRPIFGSAVLLFTCITAHWVFNITRAYQAFVLYKGGGQPLKIFSDMSQTSEVVKTGLVAASNLICDAMLIYRLWIIWERKLKVILFPVGTLLGLLVSAIGIIYQYTQFTPEEGIYDTEADRWVTSNCAFTIGTNLYCTALIAWRVWQTHGAFKALGSRNNLNQKPQL